MIKVTSVGFILWYDEKTLNYQPQTLYKTMQIIKLKNGRMTCIQRH